MIKKVLFLVFPLLTLFVFSSALAELPPPPVTQDVSTAQNQYFQELYNNNNVLQTVTVNPDGSRYGKYGDMIRYYDGTSYTIYTCVSSPNGKMWRQSGSSAHGIPAGGNASDALLKLSGLDYDVYWSSLSAMSSGSLLAMTVFTVTGANTFTKLAGTHKILVECVGGGGSGANNGGAAPTDGGVTSFGAWCSATGGGSGGAGAGGSGGSGVGGALNLTGESGMKNTTTQFYAKGGDSQLGRGGTLGTAGILYGGGGGADGFANHGGGGGGGYCRKFITSYGSATETVTIGAGGINGANGAAGVCIVYEYS